MPGSLGENRDFVLDVVTNVIKPLRILDVGAGMGTYADLLRPHTSAVIDGIEVWEPYVEQFGLYEKYDTLFVCDARDHRLWADYDLVIFGDVLEHMSMKDAKRLWEHAKHSLWGMISLPIVHYPQGAEYNNPYEVHVQEDVTPEIVRENFGPFKCEGLFPVTGTFFAEFG
jgi:hypothetical protein